MLWLYKLKYYPDNWGQEEFADDVKIVIFLSISFFKCIIMLSRGSSHFTDYQMRDTKEQRDNKTSSGQQQWQI